MMYVREAYTFYNGREIDISDYLELDPEIDGAGMFEDIPVFVDDEGYWIAAPGEEEAFEDTLDELGLLG